MVMEKESNQVHLCELMTNKEKTCSIPIAKYKATKKDIRSVGLWHPISYWRLENLTYHSNNSSILQVQPRVFVNNFITGRDSLTQSISLQ